MFDEIGKNFEIVMRFELLQLYWGVRDQNAGVDLIRQVLMLRRIV